MDLGTAKAKALGLIAEKSNNGNLISSSQNADYTLRMNALADTAQKEIAKYKPIYANMQIVQNTIPNLLGTDQGFDLVQHLDSDVTVQANGAQSYYFEVDHPATVYIEEQTVGGTTWNALNTITVPVGTTAFTAYKGLITPSNLANAVRLRFSGSYPYNIRNTALYAYTFAEVSDIPDYRPYIRYAMPDSFFMLDKVILEANGQQYLNYGDFYWENRLTFVVPYSTAGSFTIFYYKYPATIDDTTDDSYVLEVDTESCELIPYYLAAHVAIDEPQKQNMVQTYLSMYQQKLAGLETNIDNGQEFVNNVAGW